MSRSTAPTAGLAIDGTILKTSGSPTRGLTNDACAPFGMATSRLLSCTPVGITRDQRRSDDRSAADGRSPLGDISLVIVAFACARSFDHFVGTRRFSSSSQFRTTLSLVGGGVSLRLTIRNRWPTGSKSYSGIPGLTSPVRCPAALKSGIDFAAAKLVVVSGRVAIIWSPCGRYTRQYKLAVG